MSKITNTSSVSQVLLIKDGEGKRAESIAPGESRDDLELFDRESNEIKILEKMGVLVIEDTKPTKATKASAAASGGVQTPGNSETPSS